MSTKRKLSAKLGQPVVKPSAKPVTKAQLNDARAVVSAGGITEGPEVNGVKEVVEISSDSSNDSEDLDSEDEIDTPEDSAAAQPRKPLGASEDVEMEDAAQEQAQDQETNPQEGDENAEPTFGDLLLANTSTPIDVAAFLPTTASHPTTLIPATENAASLGTVLSQALRTNDTSLLESCLQTPDASIIRSTIQRLSSPLASTLLSKLAERLHRRPGRAGSLMVWVQWTLVTHGGFLATQKDLVAQLRELNRVIDERARGLTSLLSLKGKLDMLEAQMQLRRAMRNQREVDEDEEDEGVIYVEDSDDEPDSDANDAPRVNGVNRNGRRAQSEDASVVSEDMPNGVSAEMDDEEEEDDDDDDDDLIDDEAEETDAESGDEDEDDVNHSEVDDIDDDEESDDAMPARGAPPAKMARVGGLFSKNRGSV